MYELLTWLEQQHHGLRTHRTFRQKVLDLAARDEENQALYRLLVSIVDRYIDMYEGELVPTEVAEQAFRSLVAAVTELTDVIDLPVIQRLAVMNNLARVQLI